MEELKAATRTTGAGQRLKNAESNFVKDTSSRQAGPTNSENKRRKERRHLKHIEDEKGKGGPCTQEGEGYSCLIALSCTSLGNPKRKV